MSGEDIHLLLDIGTPLVLGILAYVVLMSKFERERSDNKNYKAIVDTKEELTQNQVELKEDFNKKHAENVQDLKMHMVEDRGNFQAIGVAQARIEKKIDKLLNGK